MVLSMQPFDQHAAFQQAVLDLSDAPTPANVRRYLAASALLEHGAPVPAADERADVAEARRRQVRTA